MKKSLLFVMPSLSAGGGERSLVNLLSHIDYDAYHVDLVLLNQEGIFMDLIPKQVRVIPVPGAYALFAQPFWRALAKLLRKGQLSLALNRLLYSLRNRSISNISVREQYNWKYMAPSIGRIDSHYDAAIGFLEKTSTYLCVEKVNAARKIGWVHIDYDKLGMDPDFDIPYFERLDHIVTVSEECANILKLRFPGQARKVRVIHNIVSPNVIQGMLERSDEEDVYGRRGNEIMLISIGRLHHQKGFEIAVEACKLLADQGYDVRWHVIGEGEERQRLTSLIEARGLQQRFKLLGLKSNPYPYIKQADIYVQTSRFEGKSIAIDEAKILNKPILVTNFSTAKDQIRHGVEGLIVEMQPQAVADGLIQLIKDSGLRNAMARHLSGLKLGTEEEIDKLYRLLV